MKVYETLMKILTAFIFFFLVTTASSFAQGLSSTATSTLPDSTLYVVDGKAMWGSALKAVPHTKIASVEVVKKDTLVNGYLYRERVYVRLKNEEKLQK
jgi:hypothetical protein